MSSHLIELLAGSDFPGIGVVTATRLVERFGEALVDMLDSGKTNSLRSQLTERKLHALQAGWRQVRTKADIARWFDARGIRDARILALVHDVWGTSAIERLGENPYRLLAFSDWRTVDRLAARLQIARDHPARLVGAVEAACYAELDEAGSTWIAATALRERVALLLGDRNVNGGDDDKGSCALQLAVQTGALMAVDSGFQLPGSFCVERGIEDWVRAHHQNLSLHPNVDWTLDQLSYALNAQQRAAVLNALTTGVSVMHGGAGVGKTFAIRAICDCAQMVGEDVTLLALAGKAARRLSAVTGRPAMTIARALHTCSAATFAKTVIVDEASMVDLTDFYQLIRKLLADRRLVICGDPAQLPSIGPGTVLRSLIDAGQVPTQELTAVHRQADSTGIPTILNAIRQGVMPRTSRFDRRQPMNRGVFHWENTGRDARTVQRDVATLWRLYGGEAQVISPLRESPLGVRRLNAVIHRVSTGCDTYAPGTPVVFTANRRLACGQEVVNGLQAIVRAVADTPRFPNDLYLEVETDDGVLPLRLEETETLLELGYALTVHRAQGSEWDTVIAVFPETRMLERNLVYTALSRCTQRCVMVASDFGLLDAAVRGESAFARRRGKLFEHLP